MLCSTALWIPLYLLSLYHYYFYFPLTLQPLSLSLPSIAVKPMADETLPPPPPPPAPPSDHHPPPPTTDESTLKDSPSQPQPQPQPPPPSETQAETPPPAPEVENPPPESDPTPPYPPPEAPAAPEESESIVTHPENDKAKTFIQSAESFKEESNLLSDLTPFQRKSLDDFKTLVSQSLSDNTLFPKSQEQPEISIWDIPLLKDERNDIVLLKFLRARDFKVNDSFQMLKNTLQWRSHFGIDTLLEQDLGDALDKVVFMHGHDREGHPVCYNVYGEFQNKDLYDKTFSSEEKREKFLRWRIQFLERSIRKLDFGAGGVNTIFQVNDLKNAPGPGKRELRQATKQALHLLQDNYPEFVAKQVFINVPWWYVAFYTMMSPFMTQRTKSKFVFAGPSKTAETLFKYISPEQVPIQYGGLSVDYCDCNPEFTVDDPATELNLKSTTKQFVEIICSEKCVIVWELRVVGWEVTYSAEFVPSAKDGYTVIIQKATKMAPNDNPVISGGFKVSEVGKIVLTVNNPTFKRRKLLYRYKVLPFSE